MTLGNRRKDTAPMTAARQPTANPKRGKPATTPRPKRDIHPVPEQPPLFDLGKALAALNEEFIQCRDFGHSWRPFSARWLARDNCFEQILRCGRCQSERTRYLGARGQRLESKYDYTAGYCLPPGAGHLSTSDRDKIRLASIQGTLTRDLVEE